MNERRAPVQGDPEKLSDDHGLRYFKRFPGAHLIRTRLKGEPGYRAGTIAWSEHLEAWAVYNERHPGQSAERIAQRGGFSWHELTAFLGREPTTWLPR